MAPYSLVSFKIKRALRPPVGALHAMLLRYFLF